MHHIGFVVKDIDSSLQSWLDLGFSVASLKTKELEIGVECLLLSDGNSALIELIQPLPDSGALSARLKRGGGLDHVCYLVSNLNATISEEVRRGGIVVLEPTLSRLFGHKISFIFRRSGLLVELMESTEIDAR
jgi:methylmalonyl-CoA/ethylmalonyl-CoA epimerase